MDFPIPDSCLFYTYPSHSVLLLTYLLLKPVTGSDRISSQGLPTVPADPLGQMPFS